MVQSLLAPEKDLLYQDYFLKILKDQSEKEQHYLASLNASSARRPRHASTRLPPLEDLAPQLRNQRRMVQREYRQILDWQMLCQRSRQAQEDRVHKLRGPSITYHDPILNPIGLVWSSQLNNFVPPN